jgi:hypothetical protein
MEMENPPCIRKFQKHIPLPPLKFGDDFSKDFTVLSFWGLLYSQTSYLLSTPGCCWCFNYVLHEQKRYWKWLLKSTAQMTFHQRNMAETGFGRWFRFHQQNNLDLSQTTRKWYPKLHSCPPATVMSIIMTSLGSAVEYEHLGTTCFTLRRLVLLRTFTILFHGAAAMVVTDRFQL